jgi:type IV secretion system protein VirB10
MLVVGIGLIFFNKSHHDEAVTPEENYTLKSSNDEAELKKVDTVVDKPVQIANTVPQAYTQPSQDQIAAIQEKQNELHQRLAAPLMLVSNNQQAKTEASQANERNSDRNIQFMNQVSSQATEVAVAKSIGALNSIIAEGSFIHAILESATNSDLPGYVRAVVSEPSYSEDGTTILIPRGSRLIGQYKSGMLQGQSRIFMVWTRLITPSGISIQLGSPGVDGLGTAGMAADEIDRHFWQRFGTASLLSIIGTGAANAGVSSMDQANSAAAYRTAMANSFSASANESLQEDARVAPTLTIFQGKPITVFVAKDLSFQGVNNGSAARKVSIWQ